MFKKLLSLAGVAGLLAASVVYIPSADAQSCNSWESARQLKLERRLAQLRLERERALQRRFANRFDNRFGNRFGTRFNAGLPGAYRAYRTF